jgi:hypothetical protein
MDSKEKLYYIIDKYIKGEYDINSFCDKFTVIYDIETDYDTLNIIENSLFGELCELTARYSPFEDDLEIENVYVNQEQVWNKAKDVYNKLKKDIDNKTQI